MASLISVSEFQFLNQALKIQQEMLGQWHQDTKKTLATLAKVYERTGEDAKAAAIKASLQSRNSSQN